MRLNIVTVCLLAVAGLHSTLDAQYYDNNMQRKSPQKGIKKMEVTTQDTIGPAYISEVKYFNSNGYITNAVELDETGDTVSNYHASFPDKWTEIRVWKHKDGFDTCYYYYNKKNNLIKMRWIPRDDDWATYLYTYDQKNRILLIDKVEWEIKNTFHYINERLDYIIRKKGNKLTDSTVFSYNEKGLETGYNVYNAKKEITAYSIKYYDEHSRIVKEEQEYLSLNEKHRTFYLTTVTYTKSGKEAERSTQMRYDRKLEETWKYHTNEKGILTNWSCTFHPTLKTVSYTTQIYKK